MIVDSKCLADSIYTEHINTMWNHRVCYLYCSNSPNDIVALRTIKEVGTKNQYKQGLHPRRRLEHIAMMTWQSLYLAQSTKPSARDGWLKTLWRSSAEVQDHLEKSWQKQLTCGGIGAGKRNFGILAIFAIFFLVPGLNRFLWTFS